MNDFWSRLCAWLLPGVVLALIVGGIIALSISVARGADRMPGEWLDDNSESGVYVIDTVPIRGEEGITVTIPTNSQTINIDSLLTRCLEFLRDGDVDQAVSVQYSVYRPHTLKSDAIDEIEAAQKELAKIERETQLRRDIEKALAALRGAK
jgi:hypothetical protein